MKQILCVLLIAVMLVPLCVPCASAEGLTVTILGSPIAYDAASGFPYLADGILFLPVNRTAEAMGAVVTEDSATGELLLQQGTKELRLSAGEASMIVNGSRVALPVPVAAASGVLYAPARELVTGMGGYCTFNGSVLDIDPQSMDYAVMQMEAAQPIGPNEFWQVWGQAVQLYNDGAYSEAIPLLVRAVPDFTREDSQNHNHTNAALALSKLGDCYARTGSYDLAAAAYSRSSYYWGLAGYAESKLALYEFAKACRTELSLYLHTDDLSLSREQTHNVAYEPERGIVLGYTSETFGPNDSYPAVSAKTAGMRLVYFHWGASSLQERLSWIPSDAVIELAVEPLNGFSYVTDDDVISFAQELAGLVNSGWRIMIRYANEMNEVSTPWYVAPEVYRTEYIRFAQIIRQYAPGVPMIWAPNFWPMTTVDSYYPGDDYVDYVGVSSYCTGYYYTDSEKSYGYDIFGDGVKTTRWAQQIDFLYNHYGYKKPLLIAEGAASYINLKDNIDTTEMAASQLREFYTYLPMRYPNLKYAVYFNLNRTDEPERYERYVLSDREALVEAYNAGIADEQFLSSCTDSANSCYVPFETILPSDELQGQAQELCTYARYGKNNEVATVRYEINGTEVGSSDVAPYRVNVDFSKYGGRDITITVSALDAAGNTLSTKRFQTRVRSKSGFVDVPDDEWFANPVVWAVEHKVTSGIDATHFAPQNPCTREQVVTFIWATFGKEAPPSLENPFQDVYDGAWFMLPVLWARSRNITAGVTPDCFGVGSSCTRAQVVTFLWAAAGKPDPIRTDCPFTDVSENDYFYRAVLWAAENRVTSGMTPDTFGPASTCTRAQVVTFLYKAYPILVPAA